MYKGLSPPFLKLSFTRRGSGSSTAVKAGEGGAVAARLVGKAVPQISQFVNDDWFRNVHAEQAIVDDSGVTERDVGRDAETGSWAELRGTPHSPQTCAFLLVPGGLR
jgi:hypothetical protein